MSVDGITDTAWDALLAIYGYPRAVFESSVRYAGKRTHGLRLLAKANGINPDA